MTEKSVLYPLFEFHCRQIWDVFISPPPTLLHFAIYFLRHSAAFVSASIYLGDGILSHLPFLFLSYVAFLPAFPPYPLSALSLVPLFIFTL